MDYDLDNEQKFSLSMKCRCTSLSPIFDHVNWAEVLQDEREVFRQATAN